MKVFLNCFCRCWGHHTAALTKNVYVLTKLSNTEDRCSVIILRLLYAYMHSIYSLHTSGQTARPESGPVSGPGLYIYRQNTLHRQVSWYFFSMSWFLDPGIPECNTGLTFFSCNSCSWKSFQRLWRWASHFSSWGTKFSCHSSFRSSHSLTERPVTTGRVWRNSSVTSSAKAREALEYSS